ncbi:MAG TPA: hypothetical protein DCQ97_11445 [Chitinophagaceae bacterium]|nr:hypothetical protein [Chitinophagaceae bacterium]
MLNWLLLFTRQDSPSQSVKLKAWLIKQGIVGGLVTEVTGISRPDYQNLTTKVRFNILKTQGVPIRGRIHKARKCLPYCISAK